MAYVHKLPRTSATTSGALPVTLRPAISRALLIVVAAASIAASMFLVGPEAPARAGVDLTNLLRFMAALKAMLALAALGTVLWRLSAPISPTRLGLYAVATAAMTGGPGLIWGMDHVGFGALLLHGGLAATVVLLWRDPATAELLRNAVRKRRSGPLVPGSATVVIAPASKRLPARSHAPGIRLS